MTHDILALFATFSLALIWLRLNDFAAHQDWVSSSLSRKIIHIGTGPLFVLCWLLFTDSLTARFLAALVPLAITLQFILVGLGYIRDEAAVRAMTRTGDRREILRGPLFYGLVFIFLTLFYWYETPIGITALMLMCGGDGLADILGRRFGKTPLPWNRRKSWIGSLGMLLGGWSLTLMILAVFTLAGKWVQPLSSLLPAISLISFGAALIESLPFQDIDNLTITLTALVLGHFLL